MPPTALTKNQPYLSLIILPVYLAVSLIGIYHHEIWLDEGHTFLLSRDSANLPQLLHACRYEGHPLLWNILLFVVTRFTTNILGMQLLHVCISCTTVFFICRSPFSIVEKILIIFGYYCLYEYNVISRNYGIGFLFIVLVIYVYASNKKALLALAVLLFLLANTHLYALLFSVAFTATYIVCNRPLLAGIKKQVLVAAAFIVLAGWFTAVSAIIPPRDYAHRFLGYDASGYLSPARVLKTLSVCVKGLFYLPEYGNYHFVNSFLYSRMPGFIMVFLSMAAFAVPVSLFLRCRPATYLFTLFSFLYAGIYYFVPLTYGIRYFGFFYMVFIACYWLAYNTISKLGKKIVGVILFIQFVNGLYAYTMDIVHPFSESKNVANFLSEQNKNTPVYFINPSLRPALSAYTGKKYFGMENGQQLSYRLWNTPPPGGSAKILLNSRLRYNTGPALIVASGPVSGFLDTSHLTKLAVFDKGMEPGENATVYRYLPGNMAAENKK